MTAGAMLKAKIPRSSLPQKLRPVPRPYDLARESESEFAQMGIPKYTPARILEIYIQVQANKESVDVRRDFVTVSRI